VQPSIGCLRETQTNNGAPQILSFGPHKKKTDQVRWEQFFDKAFTTERTPTVVAPDGATYKIPLIDLLEQAGVI
jgi:hypothetical protein